MNRNAFGRQIDSFEADLHIKPLGEPPFHAVFIRAPLVVEVGEGVDVLAQLGDGRIVAVQQNHLLATAFHPELTGDSRLHRYFLRLHRSACVKLAEICHLQMATSCYNTRALRYNVFSIRLYFGG